MKKTKLFIKGFTLIELMVVIVIIGILATLGLVSYRNAIMRSRNSKAMSDLKDIASAMEQYRALGGISQTYPVIGSNTSPYSCAATETPDITDFTMPVSASTNPYRCRQATGGGSFCLFVQLEGNGDGNCGGCSSTTAMSAGNTHYCILSKQ